MSSALIRKGLTLFNDDKVERKEEPKKKVDPKDSKAVISTKRRGIKKQLRRLHQKQNNKGKPTVKDKSVKSVLDEYHNQQTKDRTKGNLAYFRLVSAVKVQGDTVKKIMGSQCGRLSKNRKIKVKPEEKQTVFTEEDFRKFEKEYFAGF